MLNHILYTTVDSLDLNHIPLRYIEFSQRNLGTRFVILSKFLQLGFAFIINRLFFD